MGSKGVMNGRRASPIKMMDRSSPIKDVKLLEETDSANSMDIDRSESRPYPDNGVSRNSLRSEETSRNNQKYNNDYSKGKFTGRITLKNPFG